MIRALERNAAHRRRFGSDRDENVPLVSDEDRYATRLAALLHDIGHGPFSHATEQLIEERCKPEFEKAAHVFRRSFEGVTSIAPSEAIASLIVLSDAMDKILTHSQLAADTGSDRLPVAVAARILGSRSCLKAGYLSGIISGPVDADKLDYVARDCHHSGLPLGIDLTRLISKLEVVVVTPENAPNQELRERAGGVPRDASMTSAFRRRGLVLRVIGRRGGGHGCRGVRSQKPVWIARSAGATTGSKTSSTSPAETGRQLLSACRPSRRGDRSGRRRRSGATRTAVARGRRTGRRPTSTPTDAPAAPPTACGR